jgi:hypothetical protein
VLVRGGANSLWIDDLGLMVEYAVHSNNKSDKIAPCFLDKLFTRLKQ